jgi:hypothetical protein
LCEAQQQTTTIHNKPTKSFFDPHMLGFAQSAQPTTHCEGGDNHYAMNLCYPTANYDKIKIWMVKMIEFIKNSGNLPVITNIVNRF